VGEAAEGDGVWGYGEGGEVLFGELDKLVVGYTSGADEHHPVSGVIGFDVGCEVIAGY
jgi:hypothetical protein